MSLDIALYDKADGEEIIAMNWLRNPFGLCQWAEDNAGDGEQSLWYVCNAWAYDKGKDVDRVGFKRVVDAYWERIQKLERGYYWFDLPAYRDIVERNCGWIPYELGGSRLGASPAESHYVDERYNKKRDKLGIPMEYFTAGVFHLAGQNTLEHYKDWFAELVKFAELLQDTALEFYCSN